MSVGETRYDSKGRVIYNCDGGDDAPVIKYKYNKNGDLREYSDCGYCFDVKPNGYVWNGTCCDIRKHKYDSFDSNSNWTKKTTQYYRLNTENGRGKRSKKGKISIEILEREITSFPERLVPVCVPGLF